MQTGGGGGGGEPTTSRPLFGGAMSADFPDRYADVSDIRPVPDNQEVWTDADRDESVIMEILERVDDGPDDAEGAAAWFFRDLAEVNDASVSSGASEILSVRALEPSDMPSLGGPFAAASLCVGRQRVTKSRDRDDARNLVEVSVANVRLPQVGTDLLVTLNRPLVMAEGSSAALQTGVGSMPMPPNGEGDGEGHGWGVLRRVLSSLAVNDWGLFG